jgi:hypothetical protein
MHYRYFLLYGYRCHRIQAFRQRQFRIGAKIKKIISCTQCCGSGSGIRCFFTLWIRDAFFPDPGSRIPPLFWWNFLTISSEYMLCYFYNTGLLLKLTHKTINSMKKLYLLLLPLYLHRTRIRDPRWTNTRIRIRDKTSRIRNTACTKQSTGKIV